MTDDLAKKLARLSAEATPGKWMARMEAVFANGSVDTYDGPVLGRIMTAHSTNDEDVEGRFWSCGGSPESNAALVATLVHAYRTGALVPAEQVEQARRENERLRHLVETMLGNDPSDKDAKEALGLDEPETDCRDIAALGDQQ